MAHVHLQSGKGPWAEWNRSLKGKEDDSRRSVGRVDHGGDRSGIWRLSRWGAAGVVASAAWDAIKGFGSWVNQQGPGGADEGTWERIGQSQMTA